MLAIFYVSATIAAFPAGLDHVAEPCVDDPAWRMKTSVREPKDNGCDWVGLVESKLEKRCARVDSTGVPASFACPASCKTCNGRTSRTSTTTGDPSTTPEPATSLLPDADIPRAVTSTLSSAESPAATLPTTPSATFTSSYTETVTSSPNTTLIQCRGGVHDLTLEPCTCTHLSACENCSSVAGELVRCAACVRGSGRYLTADGTCVRYSQCVMNGGRPLSNGQCLWTTPAVTATSTASTTERTVNTTVSVPPASTSTGTDDLSGAVTWETSPHAGKSSTPHTNSTGTGSQPSCTRGKYLSEHGDCLKYGACVARGGAPPSWSLYLEHHHDHYRDDHPRSKRCALRQWRWVGTNSMQLCRSARPPLR